MNKLDSDIKVFKINLDIKNFNLSFRQGDGISIGLPLKENAGVVLEPRHRFILSQNSSSINISLQKSMIDINYQLVDVKTTVIGVDRGLPDTTEKEYTSTHVYFGWANYRGNIEVRRRGLTALTCEVLERAINLDQTLPFNTIWADRENLNYITL